MRNYSTTRTLNQAFASWLESLESDWFATLTFADTANDYTARRSAHSWFKSLHKIYNPSAMVYVVERHPTNVEAHHIHALLKFGPSLLPPRRTIGKKLWRWGFTQIFPVNKNAGRYVSKYIASKAVPDWDLLGDLELFKHICS